MASNSPYMWKPTEILEITNVSDENILLELDSGLLRLDKGRTLRMTASVMENLEIVRLANTGKLKVDPYRKKRRFPKLNL
jgi:hypothetical protein